MNSKTVQQIVAERPEKFTDYEAAEPEFKEPALEWLRAQGTSNSFVVAMQDSLRVCGRLSLPQLRGVLNCWRHQLQEDAPKVEPEGAWVDLGKELKHGTFTVLFDDNTDHLTIRIKRQRKTSRFMPGELIVGYLCGPDNTRDYRWFGHLVGERAKIWVKYRKDSRLVDALQVLSGNPLKFAMAFGLSSGICGVCNRKLTVPESIMAGIGPVCAEKM